MLELALVENLEREDLNAIDRARAYRRFCTTFGLKADDVADRLGEDRSTVSNYLRLLDLSEPIRELVASDKLSMGHARCLLGITDEPRRMRLALSAAENGLSVRALEEIVRRERTRGGVAASAPAVPTANQRSAHIHDIEARFERALKTKVVIHEGRRKASGRITIEYYSLDDFDRIAEMLGVDVGDERS
jgi:ParB family chromosome partitioning protein